MLRYRCHLAQNSITRGDVSYLERFLTTHPSDVSNNPVVACTSGSILDRVAGGPRRTSRRGVDGRTKDIIGFYSLLNILVSHGQVTDLRSNTQGSYPPRYHRCERKVRMRFSTSYTLTCGELDDFGCTTPVYPEWTARSITDLCRKTYMSRAPRLAFRMNI